MSGEITEEVLDEITEQVPNERLRVALGKLLGYGAQQAMITGLEMQTMLAVLVDAGLVDQAGWEEKLAGRVEATLTQIEKQIAQQVIQIPRGPIQFNGRKIQ